MAMLVTHLSAATASLVWMVIEWFRFGKPSLVGLVTGTIAGLATITPASGFVGPIGGVALGLAGGALCYVAVDIVKRNFKVDDSLDVLAVHGIGGATGTLLVAVFALPALGGAGYLVETHTMGQQFGVQAIGVVVTTIWSVAATIGIVFVVRALVGFRADEEHEVGGLDLAHHGESGYNL